MPASRDHVDGLATSSSRIRKTTARTESISTIGTTMAIIADPRFVGGTKMATGRETLSRFGLASDSPCIGKGIVVPDFGGRDFFGRAVPDDRPPSLGPIEYPAPHNEVDE